MSHFLISRISALSDDKWAPAELIMFFSWIVTPSYKDWRDLPEMTQNHLATLLEKNKISIHLLASILSNLTILY